MGESLNPTVVSRVAQALRPDWTRTVRARRIAAAGLVVLAGVAAVRSNPDGDHTDTVVAVRDLRPGMALTAEDVRIEKRLASTLPDGSQGNLDSVVGATLAGPTRRGEVLTDVRLLGIRLAESAAGPNARIVPLRPADPAVLDMVRPGDIVDVLAAPSTDTDTQPTMVATDAVVVLVSQNPTGPTAGGDRVVLVALPAPAAKAVAGAALTQSVTLIFH